MSKVLAAWVAMLLGVVAEVPSVESLSRLYETPQEACPAGWEILGEAAGALNDDDSPDAVLVLSNLVTDDLEQGDTRCLVVLIGSLKGFKVDAVSQGATLSRNDGGIFGDPFESVKIERKTILLAHYGGSRWRWHLKHRYQKRKGAWVLIGNTKEVVDTHNGESSSIDESLITGRKIEVKKEGEARPVEIISNSPPKPLVRLEKYEVEP